VIILACLLINIAYVTHKNLMVLVSEEFQTPSVLEGDWLLVHTSCKMGKPAADRSSQAPPS
jgi:hydrogenase maturation factor